jgi:medium-chain acyl-[acyl-carrier-protein] hydrolase
MTPLVETLSDEIRPYTDKPFVFFGHSMGAIIGFELARRLRAVCGLAPLHLFASGARAPQMRATDHRTFDWPEAEFVEDLRRLNGTPQEVLEHPELMQLILPLLRADFEVIQTYAYADGQPLTCPITVFGGLQGHEVRGEHVEGWRQQTSAAFNSRMFPGDHFFIHESQSLILRVLAQDLYHILKRLS